MKGIILIPCFNCEKTIAGVVKRAHKEIKEILVIDDGSEDNSFDVVKKTKCKTIKLEKNMGKGYALRRGFLYAKKNNYDFVITMDADGQHDPKDIKKLVLGLKDADLAIGSRMGNSKGMPLLRKLANTLSSLLVSIRIGRKISDSQCGFRAIKTKVLRKIITKDKGYFAETELIIKAAKKNMRINEVQIRTIYENEKSYFKSIRDSYKFLKGVFSKNIGQ